MRGHNTLSAFSEQLDRIEAAVTRLLPVLHPTQPPQTDGLSPPDTFCLRGQSCRLTALEWRLLRCLWGKVSVEFQDALDDVYGHDHDKTDSALSSAVKRLNRKLRDKSIPSKVGMRNGKLSLEIWTRGKPGS
jgi:hypothetical protein